MPTYFMCGFEEIANLCGDVSQAISHDPGCHDNNPNSGTTFHGTCSDSIMQIVAQL